MRIIAGRYRSRRLKSVPGLAVRPTPDRLREALFSVLAPRIEGSVFLDAYAGSGAVGLEALSRGARRVILIERSPSALAVIRENVETLGVGSEVIVVKGSSVALVRSQNAEIVFFDPPYERTAEYGRMLLELAESSCELGIAQHPSKLVLEQRVGRFEQFRVLRQGDNSLSFYRAAREQG